MMPPFAACGDRFRLRWRNILDTRRPAADVVAIHAATTVATRSRQSPRLLEPAVSCCAEHRSHPTLFVAVVALSAVAFIGQALAAPTSNDATAVAAHAAAVASPR